jgi:hypothetical protein
MIYINKFQISDDFLSFDLNAYTNEDSNIVSAKLWNQNTFKSYDLAIDLNDYLEGVNENEIFTVNAVDIGVNSFRGIWFIELETDYEEQEPCSNCSNTVIAVAVNLNDFKHYILDLILHLNVCEDIFKCNGEMINKIINLQIILEGICTSLSYGYYEEAIFLYTKFYKMYISQTEDCATCRKLKTPVEKTGLNYGTFNNTLILF